MGLIRTEDKIGKCIRQYGEFAYERGAVNDEIWRIVSDLEMFVWSIFIAISNYKEWESENCEDILNVMNKEYLQKLSMDGVYRIRRCPNTKASFPYEPFLLKLVYIVFVLEKDKHLLVRPFIEVYYYYLEDGSKHAEYTDRIRELKDMLGTDWTDEILALYRRHTNFELGTGFFLKRCFYEAGQFMDNCLRSKRRPFHHGLR